MQQQRKLNAIIFGASGAVGTTLVKQLLDSDKWGIIHCIIRSPVQEWANLHNKEKLFIQLEPNFDNLSNVDKWIFNDFDVMFVCLGTELKNGEETFLKVDKQYPLYCADIALKNKIPHFIYISTAGAGSTSTNKFFRVKGEAELALMTKGMNLVSILRPGLIKNRPHQKTFEKIGQVFALLHILPAIQCLEIGLCLKILAERQSEFAKNCEPTAKIYQNKDLLEMLPKKS